MATGPNIIHNKCFLQMTFAVTDSFSRTDARRPILEVFSYPRNSAVDLAPLGCGIWRDICSIDIVYLISYSNEHFPAAGRVPMSTTRSPNGNEFCPRLWRSQYASSQMKWTTARKRRMQTRWKCLHDDRTLSPRIAMFCTKEMLVQVNNTQNFWTPSCFVQLTFIPSQPSALALALTLLSLSRSMNVWSQVYSWPLLALRRVMYFRFCG